MFIATQATTNELRQEFHVPLTTSLHFTPGGVRGPLHVITRDIALLTEGDPPTQLVDRSYPAWADVSRRVNAWAEYEQCANCAGGTIPWERPSSRHC